MVLRHKIFITFAFLVLIPLLVIWIVVHEVFISSKSNEVISNVENSIVQLNQNLDLLIEDSARSTLSVLYNRHLIDILRQYDQTSPAYYTNHNHTNVFSLFLSGIIFNKEQIHGIHVFTQNGHIFSHMDDFSIQDSINLKNQEWFSQVKKKNGGWVIYPQKSETYYRNDIREYVSFIRLLKDPANHRDIGIIKVDFSPEYLSEITERLPGENWQIFSEGVPLFEKKMNNLLTKCGTNLQWLKDTKTGEQYLCVSHESDETDLRISNVIPKSYLYREINKFNELLTTIIVLCIIITIGLSYYVSNYLLRPLEALKNNIKKFHRDKKLNKINVNKSNGDIAELSGAYNNMLSEINHLVEEVYEMNRRNAESEYKALQSRMDPHFIFNTLESINMKAIKNKQLELSDMITELGRLIRYRLKNEEQQITLREEIKFTSTYVSIMKRRLGEALEVSWEIDEAVMDYMVPKYILQPLVENTFKHGFKDSIERIRVFISARLNKGYVVISVEDNGAGIETDKLQSILQTLEQDESSMSSEEEESMKNGIALTNINKRLTLFYGNRSKLSINSKQSGGTRIELIMPFKGGDRHEKSFAN
ncbi:sensor histidine kinase [Radiobacillus kanasensis]|uniref:sensor histidine kinase n=1 Tax=Radiobacillus kanasensis TaxID=2844358 RepID=UPI001E461F45|nr:sensor histidine kinase [Radiobacillus kanasensis]UFT98843.1 sensor histidine kinase [Radiobacillus kanasensis]